MWSISCPLNVSNGTHGAADLTLELKARAQGQCSRLEPEASARGQCLRLGCHTRAGFRQVDLKAPSQEHFQDSFSTNLIWKQLGFCFCEFKIMTQGRREGQTMGLGWSCSPGSGVRQWAGQAWGETLGGFGAGGGSGRRGRHRWLGLGSLWRRATPERGGRNGQGVSAGPRGHPQI